jgi:hypothetical protein
MTKARKEANKKEMLHFEQRLFAKLPGKWGVEKQNTWNSEADGGITLVPAKYRKITDATFQADFYWGDGRKELVLSSEDRGVILHRGVCTDEEFPADKAAKAIMGVLPRLEEHVLHYYLASKVVQDALRNHPWVKKLDIAYQIDCGFIAEVVFVAGALPKTHPGCVITKELDGNLELQWGYQNNLATVTFNLGDPDLPNGIRRHLNSFVFSHLENNIKSAESQLKSANWFAVRARNMLSAGPKKYNT